LNVGFRNSFARDLRRIRDQELLSRVQQVIEQVEGADGFGEIAHVKKLKGSEDYYRIRVSNYRVGIIVADDTVIFVRFLYRRNIYRYFP